MIDLTHLAGFALFAIRKPKEEQQEWKPSLTDSNLLEEEMKEFHVKEVNGKKQYPFELWARSKGYISFTDHGQISVVSAFEWKRALKTYDLLKWKRNKDMDALFQAYPEEREAYESKLEVVKNQIRALFTSMKVKET